MILEYNKKPDATVDEKVQSLMESTQLALNDIVRAQETADVAKEDAQTSVALSQTARQAAGEASDAARIAKKAADDATAAVGDLEDRVSDAESELVDAETNITNLQTRVADAENDVNDALKGLALAENVVGTLNWITAHSTVTTDTTPQAGTIYYIKHLDGTYEVVTDTTGKNPAQEGWYVLDEALQNYVLSHLSLTDDGLYVMADSSAYKYLVTNLGAYVVSPDNEIITATDYHSFELTDLNGVKYFVAKDIRDFDGYITENQISDGGTKYKLLTEPIKSTVSITIPGLGYEPQFDVDGKEITIITGIPAADVKFTFKYKPKNANEVKTYTMGVRGQGDSGVCSVVEGIGNVARGMYSHAEGYESVAFYDYSHTEGFQNKSVGKYSHSEGYKTITGNKDDCDNPRHSDPNLYGMASHAEGYETVARGNYSHAEGKGASSSGVAAHAEGQGSIASGVCSHAEGQGEARGDWSHAEGSGKASGEYSHAEGQDSIASGVCSHAQNALTIASKTCQTAIGRYNVEDTETVEEKQKAFIIGNGTDEEHRSNALTVDWDGNTKASGEIEDGYGNKLSSAGGVIGALQMFAGQTAPSGWLMCNGQAVSRTDYADLFNVIGTTYGAGDGSTTFNLPDMRNRVPIGAGDSYALNAKGGANSIDYTPAGSANSHTLTTNEIPAHTHGNKTLTGTVTLAPIANAVVAVTGIITKAVAAKGDYTGNGANTRDYTKLTVNATHEHTSVGGGKGHTHGFTGTKATLDVRQPYIGINYIIYAGV